MSACDLSCYDRSRGQAPKLTRPQLIVKLASILVYTMRGFERVLRIVHAEVHEAKDDLAAPSALPWPLSRGELLASYMVWPVSQVNDERDSGRRKCAPRAYRHISIGLCSVGQRRTQALDLLSSNDILTSWANSFLTFLISSHSWHSVSDSKPRARTPEIRAEKDDRGALDPESNLLADALLTRNAANIERPGVELGVTEQHLDDADIDVLLEQVGGEAMPQGVQRDALVDLRHLRSGVTPASEAMWEP